MNIKFCCNNVFIIFVEVKESTGNHHKNEINSLENEFLEQTKLAHFDYQMPQNVSSIVGKTAFLTCVVKNLKSSQKVIFQTIMEFRLFCCRSI